MLPLNKYIFLIFFAVLCFCKTEAGEKAEPPFPNIVLIMVDDLGKEMLI